MKLFKIFFCLIFITYHLHGMKPEPQKKDNPLFSTLKSVSAFPLFCCKCTYRTMSYINEKGCPTFLKVCGVIADACHEEMWDKYKKQPFNKPAPAQQSMQVATKQNPH